MKNVFLIILFSILGSAVISDAANSPDDIEYTASNMTAAKTLAAMQGKLLLVDFYATWCIPCRLMEENTLNHQDISTYLDRHYITVKVDIDDFDGLMLKDKYNVKQLPTFLVMSSQGVILDRLEQTATVNEFMELISAYNKPENRVKTPLERPALRPESEPTASVEAETMAKEQEIHAEEIPVHSNEQFAETEVVAEQVEPEVLPAATSSPTHIIQLGVFSNGTSAFELQEKIESLVGQDVAVKKEARAERLLYRVALEGFSSYDDAKEQQLALAEMGVDGFVKAL